MQVDIAIIGAGPVGIFSVFQAGMLGMRSCIIDALDSPGGQCNALYPEKPIYDIPGYPEIQAQTLIEKLQEQSAPFYPTYLQSRQVTSLISENNIFKLGTSKGDIIEAKAVIIAAGAGSFGPNRPPLENIKNYEGKSVFYFVSKRQDFADKKVVIAGGGDSAVDWAVSLSSIAEVTVVHRRPKFTAHPASVEKLNELNNRGKIKIITDFQLSALEGEGDILKKIIISDLNKNKKTIEADVLLPFFGLRQDLGPLLDFGLELKNNHILVNTPYYETNIAGIYAVGDVASYAGKLKLILTGFAEVASALHHAYSRVFDGKALHFEYSTTKGIK